MSEEFQGVKFRTEFISDRPPKNFLLRDLLLWCRKFHEFGFAPVNPKIHQAAGNLSIRSAADMIITPSGIPFNELKRDDFVEVVDYSLEEPAVNVKGKHEPSSESIMHLMIYRARPGIQAIFHGHNDKVLIAADQMGIPTTKKKQPYGTEQLAREVMNILDQNNFLVMKDHGFICYGNSIQEAGDNTLKVFHKVSKVRV
ncbi:class II aldolase/adducin family protein [bacterium]|nr:class II aldolase/adducin family protein [bacterium]